MTTLDFKLYFVKFTGGTSDPFSSSVRNCMNYSFLMLKILAWKKVCTYILTTIYNDTMQ